MANQSILSNDTLNSGRVKINSNFSELYARTLNVDDYGAVGDGVTDNYSVLQGIINDNTGSVIKIGRGASDVYLISRQINLPSGTILQINGTIKLKNADIRPILTTVTNGSTSVDVTNAGTYFSVGERVILSDDNQPVNGGGAWKTRKVGVTNTIQSIVGNTITFINAFSGILGSGSITAAANGKIATAEGMFLIDGVSDVIITGNGILDGNLSNRWNVAGAVFNQTTEDLDSNVGIALNNCDDITIEGVNGKLRIQNFVMHGISTSVQFNEPVVSNRVIIDSIKFDGSVDKAIAGLALKNFRISNCENINGIDEGEIILYNNCKNGIIENILSSNNRRYGVALTGQDNSNIIVRNVISVIGRNKASVYGVYLQNQIFGTQVSGVIATTEYMDATWSRVTTTCTVTTPVVHNLINGQKIYIGICVSSGAVPLGYYTITVTSSTTFTFTCVNTGFTTGTMSYLGMAASGDVIVNSCRNVDLNNVTIYNTRLSNFALAVTANTAFATTSTNIRVDSVTVKDFNTDVVATAAFSISNSDVTISNFSVDGTSRFLNTATNIRTLFKDGNITNSSGLYINNDGKTLFSNVKGQYVFESTGLETFNSADDSYFVTHGLSITPTINDIIVEAVSDEGSIPIYVLPNSITNTSFKLQRSASGTTSQFRWTVRTNLTNLLGTKTYTRNYSSDFSAGVDGWGATRATVTGNQDAISDGTTSLDDCLIVWADGSNNTHEMSRAIAFNARQNKIRFYYYIPASNTSVDGFIMYANTFAISAVDARTTLGVVGTWTEVSSADFLANTTSIIVRLFDGFASTFIGANVSTNDRIYFKFIKDDYIA